MGTRQRLQHPDPCSRRAILGALAAGAGAVAAACGTGSGAGGAGAAPQSPRPAKVTQATSLVYWSNLGGADGSRMKELVQQYVKETPLVGVDDIQGIAPYFDKVLAAVAAGTPPDVLGTRMTYVPFLAERGVIADLSQQEIQQLGLRTEDFDPNVWKTGEWKGKRYSVPMDLNGPLLFSNDATVRDLGGAPDKPPSTWAEWLEWSGRLTQNERFGTAFDNAGEGLVVTFMHLLHQQGGRVFAADGTKAAFNTPQGAAVLTLLADIQQRAKLPLPQPAIDLFEQRKLATWLAGPQNLNRLAKPESPAAGDLRITIGPQLDPKKPTWMAQGFQLTLPRQPKADAAKATAAFSLVNWLFNHDFEWSQAGKLPASRKVLSSDQFQKSTDPVIKHLRVWEKYLPQANLIEVHPKFVDATGALAPALATALKREQSPQTALQEAERALNAVLAQ
jgi:multiple sugar transport system substrate-binding protein